MTIEIVDFPINSMVIFHGYVSLPEGKRKHPQKGLVSSLRHMFFFSPEVDLFPSLWGNFM